MPNLLHCFLFLHNIYSLLFCDFQNKMKMFLWHTKLCRLYWYRGVTILLPGWVIWKYWNWPSKFFSMGSVRTVNSQWGRRIQLLYWLKPYYICANSSIQLQCIQVTNPHPADKTTSKPTEKCCMQICSSSTSILYLYMNLKINIQKEWHWPPNI